MVKNLATSLSMDKFKFAGAPWYLDNGFKFFCIQISVVGEWREEVYKLVEFNFVSFQGARIISASYAWSPVTNYRPQTRQLSCCLRSGRSLTCIFTRFSTTIREWSVERCSIQPRSKAFGYSFSILQWVEMVSSSELSLINFIWMPQLTQFIHNNVKANKHGGK